MKPEQKSGDIISVILMILFASAVIYMSISNSSNPGSDDDIRATTADLE